MESLFAQIKRPLEKHYLSASLERQEAELGRGISRLIVIMTV